MSLPRYPKYRDSGVKWLGAVPEHWDTRRIRFLFQIKKRIAGAEGYDVLSITQQGIKVKDIESNDGQLAMDYSKYQFVEIGDFAMNHMDLLTGYVDISNSFGVTSPDYRVFSIKDSHANNDRYFLYVFQNAYKQKIFYAFGQGASHLGRWRLPTEQFRDFVLPLPSLREQSAIASFLGGEIEKIDALTEEQQRLIELLKENRQAVISQAVTKGLNPNAPMKDSGIEWLGKVPAHWIIRKVSHLFRAGKGKNGQMLTKEYCALNDGDYPVYSGQTENEGVMATWNQFEFDFGDSGVLFSTTVGAKAMHLQHLFGRFSLSQNCMIIWPKSDICITRFFYYHLNLTD